MTTKKTAAKPAAKTATKAAKPVVKKPVAKQPAAKAAPAKKPAVKAAAKVTVIKAAGKTAVKANARKPTAKEAATPVAAKILKAPKAATKATAAKAAPKSPLKKAALESKATPAPKTAVTKKAATPKAAPKTAKPVDEMERVAKLVAKVLDTNKAEQIVTIPLTGRSSLADWMIIASGKSARQVGALANYVQRAFVEQGYKRLRTEGMPQADWVVIDSGDVVVHLFRPEVRDFYQLEKLWAEEPGEPAQKKTLR